MWHVSSRSGVATLRTAIHFLLTFLLLTLRQSCRGLLLLLLRAFIYSASSQGPQMRYVGTDGSMVTYGWVDRGTLENQPSSYYAGYTGQDTV